MVVSKMSHLARDRGGVKCTDNSVSVLDALHWFNGWLKTLLLFNFKLLSLLDSASVLDLDLMFSVEDLRSVFSKVPRSCKNRQISGENSSSFFGRFQLLICGRRFLSELLLAAPGVLRIQPAGGETGRCCALFPNWVLTRPLELSRFCGGFRTQFRGRFWLRPGRVLKTVASLQTFRRCALFGNQPGCRSSSVCKLFPAARHCWKLLGGADGSSPWKIVYSRFSRGTPRGLTRSTGPYDGACCGAGTDVRYSALHALRRRLGASEASDLRKPRSGDERRSREQCRLSGRRRLAKRRRGLGWG